MFIRFTYENVNDKFTTIRKNIVLLSLLISLFLALAKHCFSGWKLE